MKWVRAWRRADQDRTHVLQLAARVRGRAWGECCAAALLGVAVISSAVHGHVPAAACHFAQQRPSGGAAADASAAQASVAEADVDDADIMATLSFHMAELMEQKCPPELLAAYDRKQRCQQALLKTAPPVESPAAREARQKEELLQLGVDAALQQLDQMAGSTAKVKAAARSVEHTNLACVHALAADADSLSHASVLFPQDVATEEKEDVVKERLESLGLWRGPVQECIVVGNALTICRRPEDGERVDAPCIAAFGDQYEVYFGTFVHQ